MRALYSEWEAEETQPTLRQLEDFAKKTLIPLGYLFLADPPAAFDNVHLEVDRRRPGSRVESSRSELRRRP